MNNDRPSFPSTMMTTLRRILRIKRTAHADDKHPMTDEARMSLALAIAEHYLLVADDFPMIEPADYPASGGSPSSCKSTLNDSRGCSKHSWWSRFSIYSPSTSSPSSSAVSTIADDICMVAAKERPLVSVFHQ
ncbi:hypothetical protein LPJ56_001506 [Coemansia sp. RSA 2599]|nr:hypothetical protein LPJ75_001106 [Coemansia sp. RSA 2598]KAJ1827736.1 hypothetical protein LPJ56_001506 [Coemansia sp. RSA 2599]